MGCRPKKITDLCDDLLEAIAKELTEQRARRDNAATAIANAWRELRERRYQILEDEMLAEWEMQFE